MEMERINDRTIRVIIKKEDLEERGIEFLDLLGNQKEVESFFRSILDEIDEREPFIDSDSVTFQIMPNGDGLDLLISQFNMEDGPDEELDRLIRSLKKSMDRKDDKKDTTLDSFVETDHSNQKRLDKNKTAFESDELPKYTVAVSNDIEALIAVANDLDMIPSRSKLYHQQNAYFLILDYERYELTNEMFEDINYQISEYATISTISTNWLDEYAQTLIERNAVDRLRKHFQR